MSSSSSSSSSSISSSSFGFPPAKGISWRKAPVLDPEDFAGWEMMKWCSSLSRRNIPTSVRQFHTTRHVERYAFSPHFPLTRSTFGASFTKCKFAPRRISSARRHRARQRHFPSTLRNPQNNTAHWLWLPSQWLCKSFFLLVCRFEPVVIKRGYENTEASF